MHKMNLYWLMLLLVRCKANIKVLSQKSGIKGEKSTEWERSKTCGGRWRYQNDMWETCTYEGIKNSKTACSLITEDWPLTGDINLVYVNIKGAGNKCSNIVKIKKGYKCTDYYTLQVYFNEQPTPIKNISQIPTKSVDQFQNDIYNYNETVAIDVTGKEHMKLIFYTTHFCGNMNSLKLYYINCPSVSDELVKFIAVPAPSGSKPLNRYGRCVENSVTTGLMPKMLCYSNGTAKVIGKCNCINGYQPYNKECQACNGDEYKSKTGNWPCKKCGSNSMSVKQSGISCECNIGYFRARVRLTDSSAECYKPAGAPRNIMVTGITESQATVSWDLPQSNGSQQLKKYTIICRNRNDKCHFTKVSTEKNSMNLTGLRSLGFYDLSIYNHNNVTDLTGVIYYAYFNFTTTGGGTPGDIQNFRHTVNSDGSVKLEWEPPFNTGGKDFKYVVKYGDTLKKIRETTFVIKPRTEDKKYIVRIYVEATFQGRTYNGEAFTSPPIKVKGGIPLIQTIVVAASVIALVVLILLGSFCYWKKRHPLHLQAVRMENGTVQLPSKFIRHHGKIYIDPTTYNAVDDAVNDFATEFDRKNLTIGELLGGGEFAEVFKGSLNKNGMQKDVAIKTLKHGGLSKRDRDDFLGEAAILGQFTECPNVVRLEGVILKDGPNLIILEYMSNGALDSYLKKNDNQFDITQLLGMARCVANGMTYLSEIGFIHRDLAARNILVDEYNVCKVSDFGMSREINDDETYDTQGGKIPVRWTAPEAIQYKKFTSASDIWSYGILLWEIMSFGERPYWDWGNYMVLERLNAGYRLPPPMNCRKVIHDLMLRCWHKDRTKRPKFKEIRDQIEQWIRIPTLLKESASVVTKKDENLDYTVLETINKWLEAIGMGRYTETFLNNDYSTPRQILDLTMEDLEKLEIGPIGHKKKIFKAIQNTKNQVDARRTSTAAKKKPIPLKKK